MDTSTRVCSADVQVLLRIFRMFFSPIIFRSSFCSVMLNRQLICSDLFSGYLSCGCSRWVIPQEARRPYVNGLNAGK